MNAMKPGQGTIGSVNGLNMMDPEHGPNVAGTGAARSRATGMGRRQWLAGTATLAVGALAMLAASSSLWFDMLRLVDTLFYLLSTLEPALLIGMLALCLARRTVNGLRQRYQWFWGLLIPAALGGELQTADRAAWQKYRCAEGSVEARYYKGSAGPEAQIRYKGGILTAAYSAAGSDEDLTAFSDGTQTWTIGNEFGNDFYKEGNGFLVHHEQAEGIDGTEATVDNLLLHECTPVS